MLVIYAHPEDIFYPAVLFRTVYVATGLQDVEIILIPRRKVNLNDLVRYSRIPVELFKEKVKIVYEVDRAIQMLRSEEVRYIVIVTGSYVAREIRTCNGTLQEISDSELSRLALVVDESGVVTNEILYSDDLYQKVLCVKNDVEYSKVAYDAVAIVYNLFVRRVVEKELDEIRRQELPEIDISELFYFLNRVLEACRLIDNFLIVSPRTLVYCLRHVYLKHGILLDVKETRIKLDHISGLCEQEIVIQMFRGRTLEYIGEYTCRLRGKILEVPYIDRNGNIFTLKLYIDRDRERVYVNDKVYVEKRKAEAQLAETTSLLSIFF